VGPGAKMTFELTSKQGAALITNHSTYLEDIERERNFENYIKQYYDSWVDFAREQGHAENVRPILVTGVDLTRKFAMVAYSDNKTNMECEFSVGAPVVGSASLSVWGSWRTQGLVHKNCGPRDPPTQGNQIPDGSSVPESVVPEEHNQCVFIRYYTIRKRMFIPWLLKAGAGPHQLPKGDTENDSEELVSAETSDDDVDMAEVCDLEASPKVTHNVPLVGPEHHSYIPLLIKSTKDDYDDFDVIANFIFQVRNSSQTPLILCDMSTEIRCNVGVATSSRYSRLSQGMSSRICAQPGFSL
jgi:hypothetical protein